MPNPPVIDLNAVADARRAEQTAAPAAAASRVPPAAPAPYGRGKHRKGHSRRAQPDVSPENPIAPSAAQTPLGLSGDGTRDVLVVWPTVLEQQRQLGYSPDGILVSVYRIPLGPIKGQGTQMNPIEGGLVAGSLLGGSEGGKGPGEELYDFILYNYHLSTNGPAKYRIGFTYRNGGGNIAGVAEVILEHPEILRRQLDSVEEYAARRGMGAPPGRRYPAPTPRGPYGYPQTPPPQSEISAVLSHLARLDGRYQALLEAHQSGAPIAPAAAPAPPPTEAQAAKLAGISVEELEQIKTNRMAKAFAQAMVAVGITPQALAPQAAPVAQTPGQVAAAAQSAASNPLSVIKDSILMLKELRGLDKMLGAIISPEKEGGDKEEPAENPAKPLGIPWPGTKDPVMFDKKGEDEGWMQYLIRLGMNNPSAAQKVMQIAQEKLDPQQLMKFVERFQKMGPAQGQAAAVQSTQVATGNPDPAQLQSAPDQGWQPRG